jgi:hypothetical protein
VTIASDGGALERVPEPGSIAELIQKALDMAFTAGHRSAALRLPPPTRDTNQEPAYGPEVMVKVTYDDGTVDVARLDRAWSLFDAGVPVADLDCRDEPLPAVFIAAAMVHDASGRRHDLVVINRTTGQAQALADRGQLGEIMRNQVLRYAKPQVRKRAQRAGAKLTREAQYQGRHHDGWDVFAGGVVAPLLEDPKKRGLDPGRPAHQWSYKTVDPDGTETIVGVSDPEFAADPMWSLAEAGVNTVAVDEYGRVKASELSANVWHRPVEWETRDGDGDVLEHEATPSATYEKVRPPAVDIEDWTHGPMRPRPDDPRIFRDSVGEAGAALADNEMGLETFLTHVWTCDDLDGAMELASRWKAAGLTEREIGVRLCRQAGLTLQQIGNVIKRHHTTVGDIWRSGEKKLHPGS